MFINPFHTILTVFWFVTATVTFVSLFYVSAPYGRHSRQGWGPGIQARFGWLIMESASPLFFCLFLFRSGGLPGGAASNPVVLLFVGLWLLHYANRAFIYPFRMKGGTRPMALTVVLMAFSFNVVNGYLNGTWLRRRADAYGPGWLSDPRFLAGVVLFISGFLINLHSDGILRRLRSKDGGATKYPAEGFSPSSAARTTSARSWSGSGGLVSPGRRPASLSPSGPPATSSRGRGPITGGTSRTSPTTRRTGRRSSPSSSDARTVLVPRTRRRPPQSYRLSGLSLPA